MIVDEPLQDLTQDQEMNFHSMNNPQPFINAERIGNIRTRDKFENPEAKTTTDNISYLENCWANQIGLPINKATKVTISNFDNVKFLKGYQKIVTTDQGQYFKLLKSDIDFSVLTQDGPKYSNRGRLKTWSMKGVSVFLLEKPINFSNPLPHRFAVRRNRKGTCNWLEVGSYYCHTYQTKVNVEGEYKILQSRVMASKLQEMFKEKYYPRRNEFSRGVARNGFSKNRLSPMGGLLQNSSENRPWQPSPNPQVPMNWVPMAHFPNVDPLAPQGIHLQSQISNTNLNGVNKEAQQQMVRPPLSYKQAFINQQFPSGKQAYPSHFVPSHQVPAHHKHVQFFH